MIFLRKGSMLCAAVLACTAFTVGCQKQPNEKAPQEQVTPAIVEEQKTITQEQVSENKPDVATPEEQIRLIQENRAIWEREDEYSEYWYTTSDLDHNGRLEVIRTVMEGSGLYTYTDIYEVKETFDGLAECEANWAEGESQPDLQVDKWETYFDATTNTYHYFLEDALRDGAAASIETKWDYVLKNGKVEAKVLAYKRNSLNMETGEMTSSYTDAEEKEITAEEYENIADAVYAGMERKDTHMEWVTRLD